MQKIKAVAQKANGRVVLGETTPIQIGLVVIVLASFFSAVWWASAINTKLDVLVGKVTDVARENGTLRADVDGLKLWRAEVDRSGTRALDEVRKELISLREEFRIHAHLNGKP